ncbi:hypothetical protein MHYP_G00017320 [Metynnis hypsauchen]
MNAAQRVPCRTESFVQGEFSRRPNLQNRKNTQHPQTAPPPQRRPNRKQLTWTGRGAAAGRRLSPREDFTHQRCGSTRLNSTDTALQINPLVEETEELHQDSYQLVNDILNRVLERHKTSMKNKSEGRCGFFCPHVADVAYLLKAWPRCRVEMLNSTETALKINTVKRVLERHKTSMKNNSGAVTKLDDTHFWHSHQDASTANNMESSIGSGTNAGTPATQVSRPEASTVNAVMMPWFMGGPCFPKFSGRGGAAAFEEWQVQREVMTRCMSSFLWDFDLALFNRSYSANCDGGQICPSRTHARRPKLLRRRWAQGISKSAKPTPSDSYGECATCMRATSTCSTESVP